MAGMDPVAELDSRFSGGAAIAHEWTQVVRRLETAEMFWLSTVRPDGRPHAYVAKYGRHFASPDGTWSGLADSIRAGEALVYQVAPTTVFSFGKGKQFSRTRWRFGEKQRTA